MAVTHNYTVLCEYLMQNDAAICTFSGTFVNLRFESLPVSARIGIGISFFGNPEPDMPLAILVYSPNNEILRVFELIKQIDDPVIESEYQLRANIITFMYAFDFNVEGVYRVALQEGGKIVHDLPFGIYLVPRPIEQPQESAETNASN